jgi:alanyl-tRNA synthetase
MGLERIALVLQGVDSNYKTDLLSPMMDRVQQLTGHTQAERVANLTPYRVITDHARAAAFLIADGVVPGNAGRNYVTRMIIRRAARFGSLIGLREPFLAQVAETVIEHYGSFYTELVRNRAAILDNLTREEVRFQRTVEAGVAKLENLLERLQTSPNRILSGEAAFDLYATYGLPLEITRDIAREQNLDVDETGFQQAMQNHRIASGAGEAFGQFDDEGVEFYRDLLASLVSKSMLAPEGVNYDPYSSLEIEGPILALVHAGQTVENVQVGDRVEVVLPETCFYVEAGGQVSDTGTITSLEGLPWEIEVLDTRRPVAGIIIHVGEVTTGQPRLGDRALARVDAQRRRDIMRNHTATHLLHAELRAILGEHVRQAGSLVAPERLRFDFTHPEALTSEEIARIEAGVNRDILGDFRLNIVYKPLQQAISEGAMALFGEKYAETVRTISIGAEDPFSYELCGGTHVGATGDIGIFLITSESSVGAGLRRIEAVTGRGAYELIQRRFRILDQTAGTLETSPEQVPAKIRSALVELAEYRKQIAALRREAVAVEFVRYLEQIPQVAGVPVLAVELPGADADLLRQMADRFRQRHSSGIAVLATVAEGRPFLIVAVTDDLTKRGIQAGELAKFLAEPLGGSGGGRPTLAQAGGKDATNLEKVLASVQSWVQEKLNG